MSTRDVDRSEIQQDGARTVTFPAHSVVEVSDAIEGFVAAIKELPWVQMIALESAWPFARVWTIVSAVPFDPGYRRPIYEAQVAALGKMTNPGVEFRLVNVQEVEDAMVDILPSSYQTLYRQEVTG